MRRTLRAESVTRWFIGILDVTGRCPAASQFYRGRICKHEACAIRDLMFADGNDPEARFPTALTGRAQRRYVPDELFDRGRYEGREEDEVRLLYVALTRTKELLVVSWFARYYEKRARPSRFVAQHLKSTLYEAIRLGAAGAPRGPYLRTQG